MSRILVRLRATALAVGVTAAAGLLLRASVAELLLAARLLTSDGAGPVLDASFPLLLTWLAALALAAAAAWGWAVTLLVAVPLVVRPGTVETDRVAGGVPRAVRRALLTACGVALATGLALPAHADPGATGGAGSAGLRPWPSGTSSGAAALSGLPLPSRATAVDHGSAKVAASGAHVVQPGESLWSIAAANLPPGADDAEVTAAWQAVHRANRAVVGADPDLIHPDQQLRLPTL
ncbi:LysM peptidoglycan-binding domain-containing protein [Nocardioides perillae]|uniref:LysM domain-containing protein n=1 Tax=Nocardioides perillae TaxID=1119534 RepID=A0A7Y9UV41_9ACTN|nr:LysM domain-containing protein [Nocardioides perillae]NYG55215.1 hypothetical protein [Nocardioides perillae]